VRSAIDASPFYIGAARANFTACAVEKNLEFCRLQMGKLLLEKIQNAAATTFSLLLFTAFWMRSEFSLKENPPSMPIVMPICGMKLL
jgi:hypothetical protein